MTGAPHPGPDGGRADPASLLAEAAAGVGRLVKGELQLARAEATVALRRAGGGLVKAALALVLGLVGLNALAGAAVAGLVAAGLGAAAAGLIVALVLIGAAVFLALSARAALRLQGLIPDRALRGLRQDVRAVQSGLGTNEVRHV